MTPKTSNQDLTQLKSDSWRMFDRIWGRYDLLNHVLSLGLDFYWRERLVSFVGQYPHASVLDLATGTGDVAIALAKTLPDLQHVTGVDLAQNMISRAQMKVKRKGLPDKIQFICADAQNLPFPDNHFEAATVAFGLRNMPDLKQVLKETRRVLKNQGRFYILEFSQPANPMLRTLSRTYLRFVVPFLGGLISGDKGAYQYLQRTILEFPYGAEFTRILAEHGFQKIITTPLIFGLVTIYEGEK